MISHFFYRLQNITLCLEMLGLRNKKRERDGVVYLVYGESASDKLDYFSGYFFVFDNGAFDH